MKNILLFFTAMSLFEGGICQSILVDYQGGIKTFYRLLTKNLQVTDEMAKKDANSTFNVIIGVQPNGNMDHIEITSIGDSTGTGMILGVVKKSQSQWISHSGTDQLVNFQIYFYHDDEKSDFKPGISPNTPTINTQYYVNWESKAMIHLEPIVVVSFPTIMDRDISPAKN